VSNSLVPGAGATTYLLQVGVSLGPIDAALRRYCDLLLLGVPVCLLLAGAGSWWLSAFALAPLMRLAGAARGIDVRTLERRLPMRGVNDELEDVARAFNGVLERLDHAVGEMRQFSAALAHELRTPLTALRGEIELTMRQAPAAGSDRSSLASQLEEIDKLRRLIDQLLTLARAEAGEITIARDRVDLSAMSATLVDQLELVAEAKAIDLRCEAANGVVVQGDAQWLERLLLNLVDNAIKFTPEGGTVGVRVFSDAHDATIEVRDTGVGMSREVARHIFERFFRADPARSPSSTGAGLGLSLVKWIVDRHGGRIQLASEPDHGSTFSVHLPLSAR
jgi:heavy metal sensor kinase